MPDTSKNGLVRVNFSLRGFAKVIRHEKLTPFTPEPVALEAFGRFLASLDLKPDDPQTFVSLPDFRGLDYVGYIIEKERLDQTNGTWLRLEEYRIMGNKACSYKDTRVAYGHTYRYRIRTVVKFTAAQLETVNFALYQKDLSKVLASSIATAASSNASLVQRLIPRGLQSQADANNKSYVALSDNVKLSMDSKGVPQFNYSVDSPAAQALSSKAISSLSSLQAALASNAPMSDGQLQSHINTLQTYQAGESSAEKSYLSEYLVSYPSRNWTYVVTKDDTLPAWPEAVQVQPSTPQKTISVYWLAPPDGKYDIASFNVFRRNNVGDPWAMVAENVPLSASSYVDQNVQVGSKYIYAIQTNNVHGYKGFLSTQIQAELNSSFQFEKRELPLTWISGPGARPDEPNTIFAAFYESNEQLIAYKNAAISPSKTFNDTDATILVKVRSLDTQEKKEFVVKLHNKSTT